MKLSRIFFIVTVVVLGVFAAVYTFAQWLQPPGAPRTAPSKEMTGVIDSFDWAASPPTLSLRTSEGISLLTMDPKETAVVQGGKKAPLSELVPGQRVKAHYKEKEGKEIATSIVVNSSPISFPPEPAAQPAKQ